MPFDADPPSVPEHNPVGVHRRTVTVPREWRGRRVVLRVGAAESVVGAYVDGVCVGVGTDSRLPNEFDVTAHVRPGRRALSVFTTPVAAAVKGAQDRPSRQAHSVPLQSAGEILVRRTACSALRRSSRRSCRGSRGSWATG
jgi:hypothetical protein